MLALKLRRGCGCRCRIIENGRAAACGLRTCREGDCFLGRLAPCLFVKCLRIDVFSLGSVLEFFVSFGVGAVNSVDMLYNSAPINQHLWVGGFCRTVCLVLGLPQVVRRVVRLRAYSGDASLFHVIQLWLYTLVHVEGGQWDDVSRSQLLLLPCLASMYL